jgi:hypothetical protein
MDDNNFCKEKEIEDLNDNINKLELFFEKEKRLGNS